MARSVSSKAGTVGGMTDPTGEAGWLDSWLHWDEGGGRVGVLTLGAGAHVVKWRQLLQLQSATVVLPAATEAVAAHSSRPLARLLCRPSHLLRISCACVRA